jgi:hypothetical protein
MRTTIATILATWLCVGACAPAKPTALPVAEWRFVDADTGKGIPGVWINFFGMACRLSAV